MDPSAAMLLAGMLGFLAGMLFGVTITKVISMDRIPKQIQKWIESTSSELAVRQGVCIRFEVAKFSADFDEDEDEDGDDDDGDTSPPTDFTPANSRFQLN